MSLHCLPSAFFGAKGSEWCHLRSENYLGSRKRCYLCWGHTDSQPMWTLLYQGTYAKGRVRFSLEKRADTTISGTTSVRTTG